MKHISILAILCLLINSFYAQQGVEYWFGQDPGAGTGTFVSGGTTMTLNAATAGLVPGLYDMGIRPKSDDDTWGFASFVKVRIEDGSLIDNIGAAEYFWNTDPGFNSGTSIPIEDVIDGKIVVQTTGLPMGDHLLGVRLQSNSGPWGLTTYTGVTVCTNYSVTADFTAEKDALTIYLTDQSEHANSVSWIVDGDPASATSFLNPTLVLEPGDHTITQIATNECDEQEVSQDIWTSGIGSISGSVITTTDPSDLYIHGAFGIVESISLHNDEGLTITPTSFIHEDSSSAIITSWIAPPGSELSELDLTVYEESGESSTLEQAVTVDNPDVYITSHVQGPGSIRTGMWNPYSIWVTNEGNVPAYGIPLLITVGGDVKARTDLTFQDGSELNSLLDNPELIDDEELEYYLTNHFIQYTNSEEEDVWGTLAMIAYVNPGESAQLEIEVFAEEGASGDLIVKSAVGGPWLGSSVELMSAEERYVITPCDLMPGTCFDEMVNYIFGTIPIVGCIPSSFNFGCALGNCLQTAFDAAYDTSIAPYDTSEDIGNECHWALLDAFWHMGTCAAPEGIDDAVVVLGNILKTFYDMADEMDSDNCDSCHPSSDCGDEGTSEIVASIDPNDKYGPLGWGDDNWLAVGDDRMFYELLCENADTAVATAARVQFVDTLDNSSLDLSSLIFHSVSYADTSIIIEEDDGLFVREIDLRPEKNSILRIHGELDEATSVLTVEFASLDPETGEINWNPEDDAGFLNPNVTPPEGEAEVRFSLEMLPGASTHGAVVENFVDIFFDWNSPIRSPIWSNTFDGVPPNIHVTDVQEASDTSIYVSLAGGDDDSGLRYQSIYSYDIVDDETELIGTFNADPTIEININPDIAWSLFALGTDGVGNEEEVTEVISGANFVEYEYTPTICIGDMNDNDVVGVDDLLLLLSLFGTNTYVISADLSGNGSHDVNDLLIFLQFFGESCD